MDMELQNIREDSDWFEINSSVPTKKEAVYLSLFRLTHQEAKVNQYANFYFETFFSDSQKDREELQEILSIFEKNITVLDQTEKQELIPCFFAASQILMRLEEKPNLDRETLNRVKSCKCLFALEFSSEFLALSKLKSLALLSKRLLEEGTPQDYILRVSDDQLELCKFNEYNSNNDERLLSYLEDGILTHLKNPDIAHDLTLEELFQIKGAVFWLIVNYIEAQKLPEGKLSFQIYSSLYQINSYINDILKDKSLEDYNKFAKNTSTLFKAISHLPSELQKLQFADFWNDVRHFKDLQECTIYCNVIKKFMQNSNECKIPNMIYLGKDEEVGLALYQVKQDKDPPTLFAFSYKGEQLSDHFNILQDRTGNLGGGLCYKPVKDRAEIALKSLQNLIKEKTEFENENIELVAVGFGLDGAVAEQLSYMWASDHPSMTAKSYGLGVPPYLDPIGAKTLKNQKNHYSMNFLINGDYFLKSSEIFAQYRDSFNAVYKLYYHNWFLGDFSGHDKDVYAEMMSLGINQAIETYLLYQEITGIKKIYKSEEKGAEMHKFFQERIIKNNQ